MDTVFIHIEVNKNFDRNACFFLDALSTVPASDDTESACHMSACAFDRFDDRQKRTARADHIVDEKNTFSLFNAVDIGPALAVLKSGPWRGWEARSRVALAMQERVEDGL